MTRQEKAEMYAFNMADKMKNDYTPYTGKGVKGKVINYNYNSTYNRYEIKMQGIWTARGCLFCRFKKHQIDGVLIVEDGVGTFKITSKNSGVSETEGYINASTAAVYAVGKVIKVGSILGG